MEYELRVVVEKVLVSTQEVVKRDTLKTYDVKPPESILKLAPCGRTSSLDQCTPWFGHYILDSQLLA